MAGPQTLVKVRTHDRIPFNIWPIDLLKVRPHMADPEIESLPRVTTIFPSYARPLLTSSLLFLLRSLLCILLSYFY